MNAVDDVKFTRPLIRALRHRVDEAAASMSDMPEQGRRRTAVVWVYLSTLAVWAEDHDLIRPLLRRPPAGLVRNRASSPLWLGRAFQQLAVHPSTWCLLDPAWVPALRAGTPGAQACSDLIDWWAGEAPSLAYACDTGPASVTGWLVGDLLQALSDDRRKGNALAQTPWWVCDGIIDLTLVPAAREFRDETLMTIDPCCGTGHFLVRKISYLWELYTTGSLNCRQMKADGASGWTPVGPAEAIERILAGVTGVELDPLTAAVARLRVVVTVGALMHDAGLLAGPLRLDAIPHTVRPRIAVADSLIAGEIPMEEYFRLHPQHAAIYGAGGVHDYEAGAS